MIIFVMAVIRKRLPNVNKIIQDLMSAKMKPDKIILIMSEKPHLADEGIHPWDVNRGSCKIMEFRFVENIGPLRRSQTIVKEYWDEPETKIIFFDDDRKPATNLIENLVDYSNKYPNSAIGRAGNIWYLNVALIAKMKKEGKSVPHWRTPNLRKEVILGWGSMGGKMVEVDVLNQGCGCLVKPRFFSRDFFDLEKYKDYGVTTTDEIFFSYSLAKKGTRRIVVPCVYGGEYPQYVDGIHGIKKSMKSYGKSVHAWQRTLLFDKKRCEEMVTVTHKEGVSYAYFVKDMVKLRGKQWVRDSFESMRNQSDDVMVVDYSSNDGTKELAKEYGFRCLNINRTLDQHFHITKMVNKAILNAKYPLFMRLTPDIIYHKDMTKFALDFYRKHDRNKECLVFQIRKDNTNYKSPNLVYNRDLLLKAKGMDERITFYGNEHWYIKDLALKVFKLKPTYVYEPLRMQHRSHSKGYGIRIGDAKQRKSREFNAQRIQALVNNFNREVKNVVNSYW